MTRPAAWSPADYHAGAWDAYTTSSVGLALTHSWFYVLLLQDAFGVQPLQYF